jgi:hypothetical protein
MTRTLDERTIRAALAPARALEPTEAEVRRVVARVTASRRPAASARWTGLRRLAPAGLATLALLAGGAYAVPPLRAAVDDVAGSFSGWLQGGSGEAPGRALAPGDEIPDYLRDDRDLSDSRVIAEAGGYKLSVFREHGESLGFDLGNTGVGGAYASESLNEELSEHAVVVLGPGGMPRPDERGHVPLFGLIAPSVAGVELAYASGPPLRLNGIEDGFVLLAEPQRGPRELLVLDGEGQELERISVEYIGWQQYLD